MNDFKDFWPRFLLSITLTVIVVGGAVVLFQHFAG